MITLNKRSTIGTCDIYNLYFGKTDAITRDCSDFTNYETKEMGPAVPKPGANRT